MIQFTRWHVFTLYSDVQVHYGWCRCDLLVIARSLLHSCLWFPKDFKCRKCVSDSVKRQIHSSCIHNNLIPHRRRARTLPRGRFNYNSVHTHYTLVCAEIAGARIASAHRNIKAVRLQWKKAGCKSCALFAALLAKLALSWMNAHRAG
jgi:hypothetical protein